MIVVDSSTWADFFNGALTPHVERLDAALHEEEDLAVLPIIITEVLQGFRADKSFQQAQRVLLALPVIEPTVDCHVRAARLFRSLRKTGTSTASLPRRASTSKLNSSVQMRTLSTLPATPRFVCGTRHLAEWPPGTGVTQVSILLGL